MKKTTKPFAQPVGSSVLQAAADRALIGRNGQVSKQALVGTAVALVAGFVLVIPHWRWFGTALATVWISVYVGLLVIRILIHQRLTARDITNQNSTYWRLQYPIGVNLNSLWFGLGSAWVVWHSPADQQLLLWLTTFVLSALLISLLGVLQTSFVSAAVLIFLPAIITAAYHQQQGWESLSIFGGVLTVGLIALFRVKAGFFGSYVEGQQRLQHESQERSEVEQRYSHSERAITTLLDNVRDLIYRLAEDGIILNVSPSCERILGYTQQEMIGMNLRDLLPRTDVARDMSAALKESGHVEDYLHPILRKDGVEIWLSANAVVQHDPDSGRLVTEGSSRDVTEARNIQIALRQAELKSRSTLGAISDGVLAVTAYGIVDYINPVAERLTGWSAGEATGQSLETVLELREERSGQQSGDPVKRCLRDGGPITMKGELLVVNRNDEDQHKVEVTASPIIDSLGAANGVVLVLRDITRVQHLARELSYQATHDPLTGLINRAEFEVRLNDALAISQQDGVEHSLLYMDLDQFKVVNDSCGHGAGDELLRQLATHLLDTVRGSDTLARLGGDEFGLLLDSCSLENATMAAENILQAVRTFRFHWQDRVFDLGISIGAVPINAESGDLSELLKVADSACYVAKDLGRDRVHVYSPDDEQLMLRQGQAQRVAQIQRALTGDGFELVVQHVAPIDPVGGKQMGTEFLIRMRDGEGSLEAPKMFLPAAERYHLMPKIDRWVVHEALQQIAAKPDSLDGCEEYAINLSGQSLTDDGLLDFILAELEASNIEPSRICFEITETAVIANLSRAIQLIDALRARGCKFALDDFGSGLSSFQYLKQLSVDKLKIDGAFVRDVATDSVDEAMVRSIVNVAREMEIETVAEFVTDGDILQRLRAIGVDYAQGYHIARPVVVSD